MIANLIAFAGQNDVTFQQAHWDFAADTSGRKQTLLSILDHLWIINGKEDPICLSTLIEMTLEPCWEGFWGYKLAQWERMLWSLSKGLAAPRAINLPILFKMEPS